jgi:SAM-dependent methyltransferase
MNSKTLSSYIEVVNKLGRTPRGFERSGRNAESIFKAVLRNSKDTAIEIWEIYTQRREDLSRRLMNNREAVVAYLLGFHLPNMARASDLYQRSELRHSWKSKLKKHKVRVYDIGCGTGAMSLALNIEADYFLIDTSGPLLDAASLLAQKSGLNAKTSRRNIEDLDPQQFTNKKNQDDVHIYLLGYVWNELNKNAPGRRNLLRIISNHIKRDEKCLVFVTEPALDFMSRPAMELRDTLCEAGFQALYPCPHSTPCPMLDRSKDWCYSEGEWNQPPVAKLIDKQMKINRAKHASTMFAFASPAVGLTSDHEPIVVGRPVRESGVERYKGFFDYLVCDGDGLRKEKPEQPKTVILRGNIFSEVKPSPPPAKKKQNAQSTQSKKPRPQRS